MGFCAGPFVLRKDGCCRQRRRNTNFGPEKLFPRKTFPPHMCSQNDQRNVGIILSHICWDRHPPPPQVGQPWPKPKQFSSHPGGIVSLGAKGTEATASQWWPTAENSMMQACPSHGLLSPGVCPYKPALTPLVQTDYRGQACEERNIVHCTPLQTAHFLLGGAVCGKVGYSGPIFLDGQDDCGDHCVPMHRTAPDSYYNGSKSKLFSTLKLPECCRFSI